MNIVRAKNVYYVEDPLCIHAFRLIRRGRFFLYELFFFAAYLPTLQP